MSDPARLMASKGLAGELLASAKADRAPDGAARRLLAGGAVAGALAAKATSTGTLMGSMTGSTTAWLGHAARWTAWKWVALAVVGTGSVVTAKVVLAPRVPYAEAPPVAAHPPIAKVGAPAARGAAPAARAVPPPPLPEPTPSPVAATPVTALPPAPPLSSPRPVRVVAPSVAPVTAMPVAVAPAAAAPSQPSHLALEIASVDGAKRALAAGDAATALQKTEAYDVTYPSGMLAAEAHALHIEALVRLGRRDDARALLARFEEDHPGSPLLEGLGRVVQ